ncbi:signal peptidase I [Janibacter sp. GXQ6167]|uniref:signal peptidase I n=1 Tax=Janibacter sp. GXQ6167 TaxID=3240791 RepID=UPI003523F798
MPEDSRTDPSPQTEASTPRFIAGLALRALIALALLAIATHVLARPFVIPSGSMEQTLTPGDRILAQIAFVDDTQLGRGDIIVFGHGQTWADPALPPAGPAKEAVRTVGGILGVGPSHQTHTVKRIIGTPGDQVSCCDEGGRVTVNGQGIDEPYVFEDFEFIPGQLDCTTDPRSTRCFSEVTVPKGSYFVLGDHRSQSGDSAINCRSSASDGATCAQFVPMDQVVGTVGFRFWPLWPGTVE